MGFAGSSKSPRELCAGRPSGGGKSTLLRLVAGLEPIRRGFRIECAGGGNDLPAKARDHRHGVQVRALIRTRLSAENRRFALQRRARNPKADKNDVRRRQRFPIVHIPRSVSSPVSEAVRDSGVGHGVRSSGDPRYFCSRAFVHLDGRYGFRCARSRN